MSREVAARCAGGVFAGVLLVATSAGSHLLVKGRSLSELTVGADAVVIGTVRAVAGEPSAPEVTLAVDRVVGGPLAEETITFSSDSHHPPAYVVGERTLVFLEGPPWRSRQTALDEVAIEGETEDLERVLRAYWDLRSVGKRKNFAVRLKEVSLGLLDTPVPRVRRDALRDLQRLVARGRTLTKDEIGRVGAVALDGDASSVERLGAVSLLSMLQEGDPVSELVKILGTCDDVRVRLATVQALGTRRDPRAVSALVDRLADDELAVRLAATAMLGHLGDPAAREPLEALREEGEPSVVRAVEAALDRLPVTGEAAAAPGGKGGKE